MGTVLKMLLQQRHLQTLSAFNREYDRLARQIDPAVMGCGPGKAQFYRWLSGGLTGLPHPHHRRILEAMFPQWTVAALFERQSDSAPVVPLGAAAETAGTQPFPKQLSDVQVIYPSRTEFTRDMPPLEIFRQAKTIDTVGISLNLLCQQIPDAEIVRLLTAGSTIRCLFLDPADESTTARESEEGHAPGTLSNLTELNIRVVERARAQAADASGRLSIRTYAGPARFNITIVDSALCVMQPYLPRARGIESPTFVARRSGEAGIFNTFAGVFDTLWECGREIS